MENFFFEYPYRVSVSDVNYGGHVANSALLNFFQDARIAFLAELGPFSEVDIGGCGMIMPEAHVYYRQEMFLHDNLVVGIRVAEVKRSGFSLDYRVERNGELTAEGATPLVSFDYEKRKPCRLPAEFKAKLIEHVD